MIPMKTIKDFGFNFDSQDQSRSKYTVEKFEKACQQDRFFHQVSLQKPQESETNPNSSRISRIERIFLEQKGSQKDFEAALRSQARRFRQ